MTTPELFELQARFCQAMSHAARVQIVHLLRDGPCPARDLGQATGLSQPTLSRHLALLRGCGVITVQRQGQHFVYLLVSPKIVAICDSMRDVLVEWTAHQADLARALDQPSSDTPPE
jgi:ArsR family transcriptional regulator